LRSSLFQVVTFMTSTGLSSDDVSLWPHATWIVLTVAMVVGGCAGSTSGGMKCIRGLMLVRAVRNQFRQSLHPNAVLPLKIDGVNVSHSRRVTLLAFLAAYAVICFMSVLLLTMLGSDVAEAVLATLCCIGNVGPTLLSGDGTSTLWSAMPDMAKWTCTVVMLVGRLEIFTVLIIFTPTFWKNR